MGSYLRYCSRLSALCTTIILLRLFIPVKIYPTQPETVNGVSSLTSAIPKKTNSVTKVKTVCKDIGKRNQTATKKSSAGKYRNVSKAYTLLNKFRTTRSNQWYWKKNNKSKQYVYGLKKVKRDATLEKIAKVRAKEQWTMFYQRGLVTHDRPNGRKFNTAYPKKIRLTGECLSWMWTDPRSVINGWAETKCKYAGQGHRRAMLSKAKKVGIACYEKDGKTCWAMCLAY